MPYKKQLIFKVTKNLPFNRLEVIILSVFLRLVLGLIVSKWSKKCSLVSVNRLLSSSTETTAGCSANFLLSVRQQINRTNYITITLNPLQSPSTTHFMRNIFKTEISEFIQKTTFLCKLAFILIPFVDNGKIPNYVRETEKE